jgi:DNA-binding NarL/FixJ family response regulator
MKQRVLIIGWDEILVQTRVDLLGTRYEAVAAKPDQAVRLLSEPGYDLLLVCSSVPNDEAEILTREAHQTFPQLLIVRLTSFDTPFTEKLFAHEVLPLDFRPDVWMNAIGKLLTPKLHQMPNPGHGLSSSASSRVT